MVNLDTFTQNRPKCLDVLCDMWPANGMGLLYHHPQDSTETITLTVTFNIKAGDRQPVVDSLE